MNDYLNAAYDVTFSDAKLIYGKPHSLYIYEDLMLSLELEELERMLTETIKKV